jgi:uncharacterized protein YkwD
MKVSIYIFLLFFSLSSFSQKVYPYEKWKPQEISLASNFTTVSYMDSMEKEILYFANLVRINPKLFCATYLQEYIDLKQLDRSNSYLKSLISTLNDCKSSNQLYPDSNLYEMASNHALSMGEKGLVGHNGFDNRIKKFLNGKFVMTGENCDYGNEYAIDIFMSLLIDRDVPSLGHRFNLLNSDFTSIGISIQPHKKYGVNCVMDFGCDISKLKKKTFFEKLIFWK